jgi:hypothetical protein
VTRTAAYTLSAVRSVCTHCQLFLSSVWGGYWSRSLIEVMFFVGGWLLGGNCDEVNFALFLVQGTGSMVLCFRLDSPIG